MSEEFQLPPQSPDNLLPCDDPEDPSMYVDAQNNDAMAEEEWERSRRAEKKTALPQPLTGCQREHRPIATPSTLRVGGNGLLARVAKRVSIDQDAKRANLIDKFSRIFSGPQWNDATLEIAKQFMVSILEVMPSPKDPKAFIAVCFFLASSTMSVGNCDATSLLEKLYATCNINVVKFNKMMKGIRKRPQSDWNIEVSQALERTQVFNIKSATHIRDTIMSSGLVLDTQVYMLTRMVTDLMTYIGGHFAGRDPDIIVKCATIVVMGVIGLSADSASVLCMSTSVRFNTYMEVERVCLSESPPYTERIRNSIIEDRMRALSV